MISMRSAYIAIHIFPRCLNVWPGCSRKRANQPAGCITGTNRSTPAEAFIENKSDMEMVMNAERQYLLCP